MSAADPTPLALLVNPAARAGRARKVLPAVEQRLDLMRVPFRTEVTRSAEHAVDEALTAADWGEIPVVLSGDGLVGAVGGALSRGEAPLGIVPCGRGNDLARVLGIPTDPLEAIDLVAAGPRRRIDVGEANGARFLGIASTGFDSVANRTANRSRLLRGQAVYAYAALRTLAGWRPARFHLATPEGRRSFTGYSVAAANSRAYGGGMFIAPDALLDDGLLDVVTLSEVGKLHFLRGFPKVFRGEHTSEPEVEVVRTASLHVTASRPFPVYADGEHLTDLPAEIRILPGALEVIAPPERE